MTDNHRTGNPDDNRSDNVSQVIRRAFHAGDATGWFEQVYAAAETGAGRIPWARHQPDPQLVRWLATHPLPAPPLRQPTALVVGCGTGEDAEALAAAGYAVTAFDIAATAIALCRTRFPESEVRYEVADLFDLPPAWSGAFDLVLESRTIQALPWQYADPALAAIAAPVAPGGTLLVLCMGREPHEDRRGIPWALSRDDLAGFLQYALTEVAFTEYHEGGGRRFAVEYRRS